jgi:hypothetical protein
MSKAMDRINQVLQDPGASFVLKDQLRKALNRDPVDALSDATQLCVLLRGWVDEVIHPIAALGRDEFIETQGVTAREKTWLREAGKLMREL